MPGDLWTGYLDAQAADVAEVEREEEKKKQRLQEQLQKLNMESLRRTIDRDAREWELEEAGRAQRTEMLSRLEGFLSPEQMAAFDLGIDLSEFQDVTQEQYMPTAEELRDEYLISTGQKAGVKTKSTAGPDKWEYISSLRRKDPADLTTEEKRDLIGEGYRYDKKLNAWTKPKAGAGMSAFEQDIGFSLDDLGEESGETGGGERGKEQQINYEGLAKGLKAEHGIKTKQTLEAFKDELLQLYPGLKWGELRTHFK